jgi:hypothetical protein
MAMSSFLASVAIKMYGDQVEALQEFWDCIYQWGFAFDC